MVMWIFGYASLIWKAGFEYDERIVGFIKGYRRTLNLACFEHRGTYELPARVATLEPEDEAICWGVAYCIRGEEAAQRALSYLHVRESEYDLVNSLEFFTEHSPDVPVISDMVVFMSTLDTVSNKYYLGAASKEDIALQIATATGPCGSNCEYMFRLVEALREIGHEEVEFLELASAVRRRLSERKAQASQLTLGATASSLLMGGPSFVPNPQLFLAPPVVHEVSLSHMSPRLLKGQAM